MVIKKMLSTERVTDFFLLVPLVGFQILFSTLQFLWLYYLNRKKADLLLERWALMNDYEILEKRKICSLREGFMQTKYLVCFLDSEKRKKRGLVKVGSKYLGAFSKRVVYAEC